MLTWYRFCSSLLDRTLTDFQSNIGDGIIVWRVYAFWSIGREKLVLLIPIACLLGSIGSPLSKFNSR